LVLLVLLADCASIPAGGPRGISAICAISASESPISERVVGRVLAHHNAPKLEVGRHRTPRPKRTASELLALLAGYSADIAKRRNMVEANGGIFALHFAQNSLLKSAIVVPHLEQGQAERVSRMVYSVS